MNIDDNKYKRILFDFETLSLTSLKFTKILMDCRTILDNEKIKMLDLAVEEVNNWVVQRREESDKIYKLKEGELF